MLPRFTETWVPFCSDELTPAESIALTDVEGFIPYLTGSGPKAAARTASR
ncbi:hypothetical protein [Mycobacterium syngnathidarum]|nr:hypothetical protein [Mycobacterium syngnathidarum]